MRNPSDAKKVITAAFGPIENMTAAQIWALVKLSKNVRLRCRNNAAFNNYFNGVFGDAFTFRQVNKERISRVTGRPESYPGLQIVHKGGALNGNIANPASAADEDDAE